MPRIDIELTSARPDGMWTWRAAGARQPKGVVPGSVLHQGAKVGDVVRAEADFDLDGINVTSVVAPKARKSGPETLSIIGSGREEQLVTHSPLKPGREERAWKDDRGDRRGGQGDRFGGGRAGGPGGPGSTRPRAVPGTGRREGPRRDGGGPPGAGPRPEARPDPAERTRAERSPGGSPAGDRPPRDRPAGDRPPRDRPAGDGPRRDRPARERSARPPSSAGSHSGGPGPGRPPRPRPRRLQAGRSHRDAVLAALPPEQRAIAEQVLRGGMAGVRTAVEEQNTKARAAGDPEIHSEALVGLAEQLLPTLRAAEWRDRAEAACAGLDELSLRDLRTVVAGADAAGRDDDSRALAAKLREGLERRSAAERQSWVDEMTTCLTEGRVVRALRVSSRPPEQGVRFPPDLSAGLARAAGDAMSPETVPDRWLALLEAVLVSPIRRTIQPKGLPAGADDEVLRTVRQAVSKMPGLAPLVGETSGSRPVPPPPPRRPPPPVGASTPPAPATETAPSEPAPEPAESPAQT